VSVVVSVSVVVIVIVIARRNDAKPPGIDWVRRKR